MNLQIYEFHWLTLLPMTHRNTCSLFFYNLKMSKIDNRIWAIHTEPQAFGNVFIWLTWDLRV